MKPSLYIRIVCWFIFTLVALHIGENLPTASAFLVGFVAGIASQLFAMLIIEWGNN